MPQVIGSPGRNIAKNHFLGKIPAQSHGNFVQEMSFGVKMLFFQRKLQSVSVAPYLETTETLCTGSACFKTEETRAW